MMNQLKPQDHELATPTSRHLPIALEWPKILTELSNLRQGLDAIPAADVQHLRWLTDSPLYRLFGQLLRPLTLVYSPGKVGSRTVEATLRKHLPGDDVIHIHSLVALENGILEAACSQHRPEMLGLFALQPPTWQWVRLLLSINNQLRFLSSSTAGAIRKPLVVTGVREPVALYLSTAFQNWMTYGATPEGLTASCLRERLTTVPWHEWCNLWFTQELKGILGIDVFAQPFNPHQGWEIYENDLVRVLLIRQESLAHMPEAFGAFLNVDPATVAVQTTNTSEAKDYGRHYDEVKRSFRLTDGELNAVYRLPYVTHFYSPTEVECFKNRWQRIRLDAA